MKKIKKFIEERHGPASLGTDEYWAQCAEICIQGLRNWTDYLITV